MDRLSSCYFCGTATDAPLGDYQVVPPELDPNPDVQASVTLCPTCRGKLASVAGRILDAAGAGDVTPWLELSPDDVGAGGASGDGRTGGESSGAIGFGASGDEAGTSPPGASGNGDAEIADVEDAGSAEPIAGPDGADGGDLTEADDGSDGTADSGRAGAGSGGARDASSEDEESEDDAGADDEDVETEDAASNGPTGPDVQVSVRDYNRIMRWLGNRDFPIDRDAVEHTAREAYGIPTEELAAILDVAAQRESLVVTDEELRLPDRPPSSPPEGEDESDGG